MSRSHVDGPPRTEAARRSLWVTHVADLRVAPEKPLRAEAHPVDPDPSRQAAGTLRCARPLNRDASERTSRKNSREPVVWKAGSALEPLEPTGDLSTARMPPPNCIKRVIASTQCGHVGLRLPSRYGPTLTKIACSCLSKGIRAGDVLPAAVRARRTRLRTESGMLSVAITTQKALLWSQQTRKTVHASLHFAFRPGTSVLIKVHDSKQSRKGVVETRRVPRRL